MTSTAAVKVNEVIAEMGSLQCLITLAVKVQILYSSSHVGRQSDNNCNIVCIGCHSELDEGLYRLKCTCATNASFL